MIDSLRRLRRRIFPDRIDGLLQRELGGAGSVADLGCGTDSRLGKVKGVGRKIGVDAFEPSVEKSRAKGIHDEYIIKPLDQLDIPDKSFDVVMALDLVEHFPKEESRAFILTMERLARRKVVLFTPNGFLAQPAYDNNPWQEHLCGWEAPELEAMGYRVEGVLGWKALRGELHRPRLRPWFLGERICALTCAAWTARRPRLDAGLFAVKELD